MNTRLNQCVWSLCREPTSFWQSEEMWNWVSGDLYWTHTHVHTHCNTYLTTHIQVCLSRPSILDFSHLCFSSTVTLSAFSVSSWFRSGSRNQCLRSQKEVFYRNSLLVRWRKLLSSNFIPPLSVYSTMQIWIQPTIHTNIRCMAATSQYFRPLQYSLSSYLLFTWVTSLCTHPSRAKNDFIQCLLLPTTSKHSLMCKIVHFLFRTINNQMCICFLLH